MRTLRETNPLKIEREWKVIKDLIIIKMQKQGFIYISDGGENVKKRFIDFEDQKGHSITLKVEYNDSLRRFSVPSASILK